MLLDIAIIALIYLFIKRFIFNKTIGNMKDHTVRLAIIEILLVIIGLSGIWIGFVGAFKEYSAIIPEASLLFGVLCVLFAGHTAKLLHKASISKN